MSEGFDEILRASHDAALKELQNTVSVDAGLADLYGRLRPPAPKQPERKGNGRRSRDDERPRVQVKFLTVAEVAAVMRVSKMTVYRLVHGGELPAIRVGRSFRIPEQAVHDYLLDAYLDHEVG
jgi:excisionase family DNA binding protein